jgi:hypothetical protein
MPYLPLGEIAYISVVRFVNRHLNHFPYIGWYEDSEIVDARISDVTGLVRLYLADDTTRVVDRSVWIPVYHSEDFD